MTEDVSSWVGVADPQADDDACQTIRGSVDEWIAQIDGAENETRLILATLSIAVGGITVSSSAYQDEIDALFEHVSQSRSLTGSAKSNDILLRIFCLMTVYLILESDESTLETLVSEVLISGLHVRVIKGKPKLERIIEICLQRAFEKIDQVALAERRIPDPGKGLSKIGSLSFADATGAQQLGTILSEFSKSIEQARAVDREELDVLWWMLNGYSEKLDRSLRELGACIGVIVSGIELGDIGIDPPGGFIRNLLRRQIGEWFDEDRSSNFSLVDMVANWESFEFKKLLSVKHAVVEQHPHIFPIHWTLLRLHNSESKTAWQKEFDKTSTFNSKDEFSLDKWGVQALQERVALTLWTREYGS